MKWAEVSVHTSNEAQEAVANMLQEIGTGGVVIEEQAQDRVGSRQEVVLKAYLAFGDTLTDTIDGIRQKVAGLDQFHLDAGPAKVVVNEVDDQDWASAWKKYYKPVHISERLVIKPSWEPYTPTSPEERVIELDPGMAFGTGTHPSTILSLRAMEQVIQGREHMIDVGCGSGILSIAGVRLGVKRALALDVDEVAVQVATQNIADNGLSSHITVRQNDLLQGVHLQVDLVVANILAEIIVSFVKDVVHKLKPGGYYIASGIIRPKVSHVQREFIKHGLIIAETLQKDDWVAIVAQKR